MDINILVAAMSALLGGTGAKIVDVLMRRYRRRVDASAQIRNELWDDKEALISTNEQLLEDLEVVRAKYFAVIRDRNQLKVDNMKLQMQIERSDGGDEG